MNPPIINRLFNPDFIEKTLNGSTQLFRQGTYLIRLMPGFIIIGAQRCGTTSLYNYLAKHPGVLPALQKEVHFFDYNFKKGIAWYRSHFQSHLYKYYFRRRLKQDCITGEASPYYIFHPHASKRIHETIPKVKLIILLRNPIDRAYSHYHLEIRLGNETLSFEDAIEKEEDRLHGEIEKIRENEHYYSFNHINYSYLTRGIYVDQIRYWMRFFQKEQILILRSEDFYDNPPIIFRKVIDFLGLPAYELNEYKKYNKANYQKMEKAIRKRLIDYFAPHNQRLYDILGESFDWDR